MNKYYTYENYELWDEKKWEDRLSSIRNLVIWIGENERKPEEYRGRREPNPTGLPYYQIKNHSVDDPQVVDYWDKKGIHFESKEMGRARWISMIPNSASKDKGDKLPVLLVMHMEDYSDPYWAMRTMQIYAAYNEMAAKEKFILIYNCTKTPDRDLTLTNMLQEALVLYPADVEKVFLDLSVLREKNVKLSEVPDYVCKDRDGNVVKDPDGEVEYFSSLKLPVLNIRGRWEIKNSLSRNNMTLDRHSNLLYDRERELHSELARKVMEGIVLEYKYNTLYEPELIEYWNEKGLQFDSRETKGERWLVFTPKQAFEEPEKKLPLMLIMQEVTYSNEHYALTALSYYHEYTKIAGMGECILLFFVLEDADSNDLLEDIIKEAAELYPVDLSRVYLTGHSHNGHYAVEFVRRHPKRIAAIATSGNFAGLVPPDLSAGALKDTDERVELLSKIDIPLVNFSGMCESGSTFPLNRDGMYMRPDQERIFPCVRRPECWQLRLRGMNCPMKTEEEIVATADSEDTVERQLGIPCDRSEVIWMDGVEHYIADIKNNCGKFHFRVVGVENTPHIPVPSIINLSWSYMRRFQRDMETGEILERY